MVVFLPYRSDAFLEHIPLGTVGLMAANALVYLVVLFGAVDPEGWMLDYADPHPLQWLTSIFLHVGILHLAGNLLFLWVFGPIVEGVAGWKGLAAIFAGIGVLQNALEQLVVRGTGLDAEIAGGSYGASAAIFGLMVAAIVWAPRTDVSCLLFLGVLVRRYVIPVTVFGVLQLLWELAHAATAGFGLSSALLHLLGAAIGLPAALLLLRLGVVDCGGWDWFSVRERRRQGTL